MPHSKALSNLLRVIRTRLTEEELKTLYFELGIDYDSLASGGKDEKARALIIHFENRDDTDTLVIALRTMRPDLKPELKNELAPANDQPNIGDPFGDWMQDWIIWQTFLPLVLLVVIYIIEWVVLESRHPFQIAFSHGDLLLFSGLMLVSVSIHIKQMQQRLNSSLPNFWLFLIIWGTRACAFIFLLVFGILEYDVIHKGYFSPSVTDIPSKLTLYSCFSCSVVVVSLGFSAFSFWKVADLQIEAIRYRDV